MTTPISPATHDSQALTFRWRLAPQIPFALPGRTAARRMLCAMSDLRETLENEPEPREKRGDRELWPADVARRYLRGLTPPLGRFDDHPRTDRMWCALLSLPDAACEEG